MLVILVITDLNCLSKELFIYLLFNPLGII